MKSSRHHGVVRAIVSSKSALRVAVAAVTTLSAAQVIAQTTYTYNSSSSQLWLTTNNWTPNTAFPGVAGSTGANTDIAQWTALVPSAVGINSTLLTGSTLSLGGIFWNASTGTNSVSFGNAASGAFTGTLRLNTASMDPGSGAISNGLIVIGDTATRDITFTTVAGGGSGSNLQLQLGASGTIYAPAGRLINIATGIGQASAGLGLTKAGAGTLTMGQSTTQSFTGGLTLNAGQLNMNSSSSLGGAGGTFTYNGGAVDNTGPSTTTIGANNPIVLNSTVTFVGAQNKNINFGTGPVSLGTAAGTSRTITTAGTGSFTFGGPISDGTTAKGIVKEGVGNLTLTNPTSSFTGGVTLNAGTLYVAGTTIVSSGVATGDALGLGTLTLNGGIFGASSAGDHYVSNIVINADITLGNGTVGSARLGLGGNFDLGGATRTLTLNGSGKALATAIGVSNTQFRLNQPTGITTPPKILNGNLRFVGGPALGANDWGSLGLQFSGTQFANNAGLTIGNRVVTSSSGAVFSSTASFTPSVTVESGGVLNAADSANARALNVWSLSGAGTVTNLATISTTALTAVVTTNTTGTSTFSGIVADGANVGPALGLSTTANGLIQIVHNGSGKQIYSNTNVFTGGVVMAAGLVSTGVLANGGQPSGIGSGASAASNLVLAGGGLEYTGSAISVNRKFQLNPAGGSLISSGSGAIALTASDGITLADTASTAGTTTTGSNVITAIIGQNANLATPQILPGMTISGPGIAPGTTVVSTTSSTVTISQPAIADGTLQVMAFTGQNRTLTLGGTNVDANTLSAGLADSTAGKLGIAKAGAGSWTVNGSLTYTGNTNITGGTLNIDSNLTAGGGLSVSGAGSKVNLPAASGSASPVVVGQFSNVTVGTGGTVTLRNTDRSLSAQSVVVTSGLSIANDGGAIGSRVYTGQIDVTNNDMIVRGGNAADIQEATRVGQAGDGSNLFVGQGLTSSVAAADAGGSLRYAVGVIANDFGGAPIYDTFDGVTVAQGDVLVKFTYFGDADLNGVVDDTDFFLANNGYLNALSGWLNGDFDYSGVVDDTDFFLLNNGYLNQGAALRAGGSVPEPTGLGVVGLAAGVLLGRRRK